MNQNFMLKRITRLVALATFPALLLAQQAGAEEKERDVEKLINVRQMAGTWTATLSGVTGCGVSTLTTTFTLDASGNGSQVAAVEHTAACGEIDQSGQPAQIQSLNLDGSGFIALGCGAGCGFGFYIQLSRNLEMFNMGPQSVAGNYLAGVAVRK